jgi:hypothetical protein
MANQIVLLERSGAHVCLTLVDPRLLTHAEMVELLKRQRVIIDFEKKLWSCTPGGEYGGSVSLKEFGEFDFKELEGKRQHGPAVISVLQDTDLKHIEFLTANIKEIFSPKVY